MLKKLFRFHGHGSLNFVYKKGRAVRVPYLQLKYSHNNRRDDNRLAVVVAKKVTKSAPTRNKIRRRVYETARQQWMMIDKPYDLVITVFDERIAIISQRELQKLITDLFKKAEIIKG